MQDRRRIPVDLDSLLKVASRGVSVGVKSSEQTIGDDPEPPSGRRIAVALDTLMKANSTGVAVGTKTKTLRDINIR